MVFVLLRRFLLLFIPKNKITAERKLRFLSKTGVRNGKYRNPEDSGRNMQPSNMKHKLKVNGSTNSFVEESLPSNLL